MKAGIVGLGNIAQSTYLPILSKHPEIELIGCYARDVLRTQMVAEDYRITGFTGLDELIAAVDIVFVHVATVGHFEVVQTILKAGKPVYVDKPLTENLEQSKILVKLAREKGVQLMVGFNRRFSPAYRKLKSKIYNPTFIHVEKHRITPAAEDARITLIDDFIHIVDTLQWLVDETIEIKHVSYGLVDDGGLNHINVQFTYENIFLLASMHRNSGTDIEQVTIIDEGQYLQAKNMLTIEKHVYGESTILEPNLRIDAAERRGFKHAVDEFINSVKEQRMPLYYGDESLVSQDLVEEIIRRIF